MKKLKFLSLITATVLSSLIIYSCMKEDVVTEQPEVQNLELQQNKNSEKVLSEQKDVLSEQGKVQSIKKENVNVAARQLSKISSQIASVTKSNSHVDDEPCGETPSGIGCTSVAKTKWITIPATALNPFDCEALAKYIETICIDPTTGNASITIQLAEVAPGINCPTFDHWVTLSDPDFAVAFEEFFVHGSYILEDLVVKEFFTNYPNKTFTDVKLFKTMCYKSCIFSIEGQFSAGIANSGQSCCKRERRHTKLSNGFISKSEPTFTSIGDCDNKSLDPANSNCAGAIKTSPVCSGSCEPNEVFW